MRILRIRNGNFILTCAVAAIVLLGQLECACARVTVLIVFVCVCMCVCVCVSLTLMLYQDLIHMHIIHNY